MHRQGNRVDSDEEPPAAAAAHVASSGSTATMMSTSSALDVAAPGTGRESPSLDVLSGKLKAYYDAMTSLPPCVPAVVTFCVGGRLFAVSRDLIEKDPASLLFLLTLQHYVPPPTADTRYAPRTLQHRPAATTAADARLVGEAASSAITLPERNPTHFAMLLNLLRGYRNAIPAEWMECCREEAKYYGLEKSWGIRFNVLPNAYYFRNPLRNPKMLSETVLGVASDFMTKGEHHIDFSVAQCDRIGVGVISTVSGDMEALGLQSQDGSNGAFYWNDGKISIYLGESRMVETGFPFPAGALIRVVFDADENIIRWVVNGEYRVAMERLPDGRQYAFASVASRNSQVTIMNS